MFLRTLLLALLVTTAPVYAQTSTDRIDGLSAAVAIKAPVKAVTSANITLSGLQTVGGVALADGDRVLVKSQSTTADNGIYNASSSAWTRAKDFDGNRDAVKGTLVVTDGVSTALLFYRLSTADPVVIGTSNITFVAASEVQDPYPRTTEEIAASVTPTDLGVPQGTTDRYGLAADCATDDTTKLANMFKVGYQGVKLDFGADKCIVTSPFTMSAANTNMPPAIVGYNVTFKAKAGSSGDFITVENPQATWEGFTWDGYFTFDSNALTAQAFVIHGAQRAHFGPMRFINSVGAYDGISTFNCQAKISAAASYGVYYNIFEGWIAGFSTATGGTGCGIGEVASDDTNRIASNLWLNPKSAYNDGPGYYIHHSSDTYIGAEAEKNDMVGVSVDFSTSLSWYGGYTEHNDQSFAGDNTTDGSTDLSITLTSDSNRVMIFGGRHVGDVTGEELGSGNITLPGTAGGMNISQTGMGFGGAAAVDNGINFLNSADFLFRATGSTKLKWDFTNNVMQSLVPLRVPQILSTQANVASATNITFDATADIYRITSTTTINTITAPPLGSPCIRLLFTANTTVNDDSTAAGNLILAGGANFSGTSEDMLGLCWGTTLSKWVETGRSVN